jgi:S-DNA-T family DNA segregation ATPase FtsK/SpoIIIE
MLEQRNLKSDLLALSLLAVAIFLGASLLSYHPADPPNRLVYPERSTIGNLCGRSGAWVSATLLNGFGQGAYYLLASLVAFDALLLARREITVPMWRLIGWLLSLAGLTAFVAMAMPGMSPGPVIGSGGYLGAAGRGLLERHFAATGAYIIAISLIVGGLFLCTDYVLLRLLALTVGIPATNLGKGVVRVGMAYAEKVRRRSDLDPPIAAKTSAKSLAVHISGRTDLDTVRIAESERTGEPTVDEADAGGEDSEDAAESMTESAAESAAGSQETGESALRVRKPKKSKREEIIEEIEATVTQSKPADYELPSLDLLMESEPFQFDEQEKDVRRKAKILEKTFADFGFNVRVVEIQTGPVIAQFEVALEAGLRLSKITGLADDLAIALRVPSVRIVAPIPGKNTVGVEVPNTERQLVRLREVMEEATAKAQSMRIPIYLGKDVAGNSMVVDLTTLPHLLIAGRTGTGKSVCLNSIIVSMLMTRRPDEVRTLLIDPKMVELSQYKNIPHLMHPVVTDMRKAEAILGWAVEKMEERYQLLARAGVRHISVYNQLGEEELMERIQPIDDVERRDIPTHMPYIVIVADEMADLMMTAAKEVEGHIIRLAQKSRAVGIHLVLATQKPTVDVITGLIKSNLPARICFQVASRVDSRVVLDEMGADKLLGNGDMLFLWPGTSTLYRGQGTYLGDDEINKVIDAVATGEPQYVTELVHLKAAAESDGEVKSFQNRDELYEGAVDLVVREGRGSCSLLQRAMGIGYGRAARLIDFMAEDGIVGAYNGSQAREVLISLEQWEAMRASGTTSDSPPRRVLPPPPVDRKRASTIVMNAKAAVPANDEEAGDDDRDEGEDVAPDEDDEFVDERESREEDEADDADAGDEDEKESADDLDEEDSEEEAEEAFDEEESEEEDAVDAFGDDAGAPFATGDAPKRRSKHRSKRKPRNDDDGDNGSPPRPGGKDRWKARSA